MFDRASNIKQEYFPNAMTKQKGGGFFSPNNTQNHTQTVSEVENEFANLYDKKNNKIGR